MATQLSYQDEQFIRLTNYICTPLSMLGAGFLIYKFYKSPAKTFPAKLIVSLACSDMLLSVVNIFDLLNNETFFCNIEGFFMSTGIYSNVLWTTFILMVLYLQFVKKIPNLGYYYNRMLYANIGISVFPAILTTICMIVGGPLYFGAYLGNCNILPIQAYVFLMIIPFGIIITVGCILLVKVYLVMRDLSEDIANAEYKRLFSFAAVLMLLYIPISVDYATKMAFAPLTLFCLVTFKSIGFINALQYGNSIKNNVTRHNTTYDSRPSDSRTMSLVDRRFTESMQV